MAEELQRQKELKAASEARLASLEAEVAAKRKLRGEREDHTSDKIRQRSETMAMKAMNAQNTDQGGSDAVSYVPPKVLPYVPAKHPLSPGSPLEYAQHQDAAEAIANAQRAIDISAEITVTPTPGGRLVDHLQGKTSSHVPLPGILRFSVLSLFLSFQAN